MAFYHILVNICYNGVRKAWVNVTAAERGRAAWNYLPKAVSTAKSTSYHRASGKLEAVGCAACVLLQ